MRRDDWVLLALLEAETHTLQPVQLQKALFLLGQHPRLSKQRVYYKFEPYHYGPFSREVYTDAERLAENGLMAIAAPGAVPWRQYCLAPAGVVRATNLRSRLPADVTGYVQKVVRWTQSMGFRDLVKSIYANFPDYRKNSVFQE